MSTTTQAMADKVAAESTLFSLRGDMTGALFLEEIAAELRRLAAVEDGEMKLIEHTSRQRAEILSLLAERDKEKAARQDAQRQLYEERARLYEMVSTERVKTSQALAERDQLRAFVQGYSMELWEAFERRNG